MVLVGIVVVVVLLLGIGLLMWWMSSGTEDADE